jgi:spore coat polysaccharide biosynthesis protein SpsF
MGSTRLPGKVLRRIGDLPLLGHVLGRLSQSKFDLQVVVATSALPADAAIAAYCETLRTRCFRGSELDVLDRYYQCARQFHFDHIVRLTADNPFTDIEELDRLITRHLHDGNAFTHSFGTLPIGVGAEIFSALALERSWQKGLESHHREHVDEYLLEHPDEFKTGMLDIPAAKTAPGLRLTVDTEDDWWLADSLARQAGHGWLTTERIIALCSPSA